MFDGMNDYTRGYLTQLVQVWQVIGDPTIIYETLTDDVVDEALRVWGVPKGLAEAPYERMVYVGDELQRRYSDGKY